jgi:hypothetical protein
VQRVKERASHLREPLPVATFDGSIFDVEPEEP